MIVLLLNLALAEPVESIPQESNSEDVVRDEAPEELKSQDENAEPNPEVWLQCSPVEGLIDLWDIFPQSLKDNAGGFAKATPESFVDAGGVLDGTLVAYGSKALHLELDYNGDSSQVESMLKLLINEGVIWQSNEISWFPRMLFKM